MMQINWTPTPEGGPQDAQVVVDGEAVAWIEQEVVRAKHDPTSDKVSGRWIVGTPYPAGVRASRAAAIRLAERVLVNS